MSEPVSLWGVLKSFLGIFGSIAKEVIKKYNQPKVVCKSVFLSKSRNSYKETFNPNKLSIIQGRFLNDGIEEHLRRMAKRTEENKKYEAELLVEKDYRLEWHYEIYLTNNTEHTAYKIKVISSDFLSVNSEVDYTKPLPPNQTVVYKIIIRKNFTCNTHDANSMLLNSGDFLLRVEYANVRGTRYYTLFKSDLTVEEQNQFGRIK